MKVLITGASGFIGSRITNYFVKKKVKVLCLKNVKKIKLEHKLIKKIGIKFLNKSSYKDKIDAIIHCASKTPSNCTNDKAFYENIQLMKMLLNFSKQKKIKYFIFLSSVSVYGLIKSKILKESNSFNSPNSYGKSKINCEKMLINFKKKNKKNGFKAISIRLPGVVGRGSHGNFISETTKKIFRNKKVVIFNPNSFFNNIIFVNSLSNFILKLIKKKKINIDFINLASSQKIKIIDVINYIYLKLKKKNNVAWSKIQTNTFTIDISKARKIGYNPLTVKASLNNYLNEFRKKN